MSKFISVTTYGKWWKGEITFTYNLKKGLLVLLAIIALGVIGFALYCLGTGLLMALKWLWGGIVWLSGYWKWLLGILLGLGLLALLVWGLRKIKWPKFEPKNLNWRLIWVIGAIILALLVLFGIKNCSSSEKKEIAPAVVVTPAITPEHFNELFDWVVISRAYLDGVQDGNTPADRALVGLKFVDGKPVNNISFEGKTYEEAIRIIAEDWRGLISETLGGIELSERQLVAVTLFAMRNGKYGFIQSDFLKELQQGRIEGAEKTMALHKADGTKRQLGDEAKQYLWVLMQIYNGNIDFHDLIDYPILSYKTLYVEQMYNKKGLPRFSEQLHLKMQQGSNKTPRQALEL